MEKLNKLIAASIITAFMACQKEGTIATSVPPNTTNNNGTTVTTTDTLTIKMSETVSAGSFSIKLDSIQDSRCPTSVVCVWAGVAEAKLIVKEGNNSQIVRLQTATKLDTATVFNRSLRLLKVSPYPITAQQIPQSDYVIQLLVQ
jgi:hypothetical protein